MKKLFQLSLLMSLIAILLSLSGCTSLQSQKVQLPVTEGRMELVSGFTDDGEILLPETEVLTRGSVFLFSPVEFTGQKIKLGLEEITSPLGQNVALRQADEGLLRDIEHGQAKTFDVRYQLTFNTLKEAKEKFRHLQDSKFVEVESGGKKVIEITHWAFRFVMLFSHDRKAFRVLIDNIHYYHPAPEADGEQQQGADGKLPVIISFAYLYPDPEEHTMKQTNIVFDYLVDLDEGKYTGNPQFSNWIPLQDDAETAPYSIEIAVAEISEKEEFFRKIHEWFKNVRGLFNN